MSYSVMRIAARDRERYDAFGVVVIRRRFASLARQCLGFRTILYQSVRQERAPLHGVGYFAMATIALVQDHATDEGKSIVLLKEIAPLLQPRGMVEAAGIVEVGLRSVSGEFSGWKAGQDVRLISFEQFNEIAGAYDAVDAQPISVSDQPPLSRLKARVESWKDPKFRQLVYAAYNQACAISGVTLLRPDGYSDLEAAHIFPYAHEAHDHVNAGILLAPNWHRRFDSGAITIHPD